MLQTALRLLPQVMHSFSGTIRLDMRSVAKMPLNMDNMLLRGSTLKNTSWAIGLTIYTGAP